MKFLTSCSSGISCSELLDGELAVSQFMVQSMFAFLRDSVLIGFFTQFSFRTSGLSQLFHFVSHTPD